MIKFNIVRPVKHPKRDCLGGDAGIDFFLPEYTIELHKRLEELNPFVKITEKGIYLANGMDVTIPSGVTMLFEKGITMTSADKSGVARRGFYTNIGVVDAGYRGEMHIYIENKKAPNTIIEWGEKLVQFLPLRYDADPIQVYENLTPEEFYGTDLETRRGDKKFGENTGRY